jgi:hypothetical protein
MTVASSGELDFLKISDKRTDIEPGTSSVSAVTTNKAAVFVGNHRC